MCDSLLSIVPRGQRLETHVGPLRVVHEGDELPADELVAVLAEDGQLRLPAPPLLARLSANQREAAVLAALWLKATRGSIDAARAWLQHHRWRREMRLGRAPQRSTVGHTHRVVMIDDIGLRAGDAPTRFQLGCAKADGTDVLDLEEKQPAD